MLTGRRERQHGLSLFGLLFVLVVLSVTALVLAKAVPSYTEYRAAVNAVKKAKDAGTIPEIQKAFDRSAQIDDITAITGKDLIIVRQRDDIVVSFSYSKKLPLFANVSLVIDYAGSSKDL